VRNPITQQASVTSNFESQVYYIYYYGDHDDYRDKYDDADDDVNSDDLTSYNVSYYGTSTVTIWFAL
jgi:hypothetical protein